VKNIAYILSSILICLIFVLESPSPAAGKERVHPRNKKLISDGLVPQSILKYFPEVPKITPYEALALHTSGKAIFIAIGHDSPRLMDGWLLKDYMRFNPKRLRAYRIPTKGMYIILYCG